MMFKYLFILGLIIAAASVQQPEGIKITIRKEHRKITYVAENTTDESLDLFFKVESEGFRRTADRPLIETIPAHSKKDLISLVPIRGKDTTHTYIAIVTEKRDNSIRIIKTDSLRRELKRIQPDTIIKR